MSVASAIGRFFSVNASGVNGSSVNYGSDVRRRARARELDHRELCAVLTAYYLNNGLYETLRDLRFGPIDANSPNLKPIRNPVPAAIDFFSAKAFPDPLELKSPEDETDDAATTTDPVLAAIEQVWAWSNWDQRRQTVAHQHALYGEAFVKVVADAERGRVWFEAIDAACVVDFETDERDYLTWIRIDVPKCDTNRETGEQRHYTRVEVWSKADGTFRIWEADGDAYGKPLNQLGPMRDDESGTLAELGIDFVPVVRIPFRDIGEKRAIGAVLIALEVVTEGDLMATNLHSVVFNDLEGATVITREGTDANNRPLPPVRMPNAVPQFDALGREIRSPGAQADGSVTVGKRSFWSLPGGAHLEFAVPQIDITGALAVQQDHDDHLERLLPSLSYSRISELTGPEVSGKALRYKLTAALDQLKRARKALLAGLKQLDLMALTLGLEAGIFAGLPGSFEDGSWDHDFVEQDVLPSDAQEDAQTEQYLAQAFGAWTTAGLPMAEALRRSGYSEDEAAEIVTAAADEAEQAMERQAEMTAQMEPERGGEDDDAA